MNVIGLLSWFDERPSWLTACITSYAQAGITHLVALDGAYALYPQAQARSRSDQPDAIVETCNALNIGLTLHRPQEPWAGNEIEKRTSLFRHAEPTAQPGIDWYLVIDADELCTQAADDWQQLLTTTTRDAADVLLTESDPRDNPGAAQVDRLYHRNPTVTSPIRKLFRATPGLHCADNHYTYRTPDGRNLWANHHPEPALDLTHHLIIEHRTRWRTQYRQHNAQTYYDTRNQTGAETHHTPHAQPKRDTPAAWEDDDE